MEKLTDAEVVKALECCFTRENCEGCPIYKGNDFDCLKEVGLATVDLIKRKDAEIERLQKIIVGFMDEVGTWSNKYDVDISTILKLPLLAKEDWNIRNNIKSEVYKEFATTTILGISKLPFQKNKGDVDADIGYKECALDACHLIDNLLKELTEGSGCNGQDHEG